MAVDFAPLVREVARSRARVHARCEFREVCAGSRADPATRCSYLPAGLAGPEVA